MQKHLFLTAVFFIGFSICTYSQFPVGKNIKIAKTELKQYLKTKGYNYLKTNDNDEDLEILEFSEEFSIVLAKNHYENVQYLNFSTFKKKVFERLKTTFNFSKWTYIGEFPDESNELESIYRLGNYKIRMVHTKGIYQFIVYLVDDN